ncbi:MAG: Sapep family Mn(2+)-dependent dipeptidase, partial [Clostridia bacterium]|nr:Sapep family Mn(2+)-dependent dipeptidase [Clostridia bacterium]
HIFYEGLKMTEEIKKSISEIIKINSEQTAPAAGAPCGKGAREALDYFLSLASSFGFETKNYEGYAGEVIFGEGEELAVLVHLDVVPAGSGWLHEPYGGEIDEVTRRIWGRGTMDDKGPAIITLYAMKALKDEGFTPKRKIKLIAGCNEESGWGCIDYYKKHAHMPDDGFSPDADFPAIYAEKGILHLSLKFRANASFSGLCGGERANMVCDRCEVTAPTNGDMKKYNLTVENGKIVAKGKSAHGSTPDEGINAIAPVLQYLGLDEIYKTLFVDCFGLKKLHDETGFLTFSPNVIKQTGNEIAVTCDIRYPATFKTEDILKHITVPYEILSEQAPLYNDANCFLIKTLNGVYNEVTGKNLKPLAIGGGTYARALKCGAGFGPEEPGEESTIHQANEYITFEKIEKCFKIYKLAIERLTK